MPQVTIIPATKTFKGGLQQESFRKKRVAAYARVSTDSEEQETSYDAQIKYYTNYIKSRADWEFVKMYSDKAVTGTNTKQRKGFTEMIDDALAGKIDLIITKSVSRFSRNTVDSLVTIRKLKERGIEVYFEKENIYTLDSKGEVLLTIMSSLAQDESRSISDNVTWGKRKAAADGKVYLPYKHFLGYRKGADKLPEIVPEEAEIVKEIYRSFMEGKTPNAIAAEFTCRGVPTPTGKSDIWKGSTVLSILTNEKYKGSAILQKKFTVDFLTKKMKKNEGEVPQYYIENSHPYIVAPAEFEIVQQEIERRKRLGARYSGCSAFASKVICADCGSFYGPKVWHSTDKYKKVVYRCNNKYNDAKCNTPVLTEENLKDGFIRAMNRVIAAKEKLLDDCRIMQDLLSDTKELDATIMQKTEEQHIISEMIRKIVERNARVAQDQTKFWDEYKSLETRYKTMGDELAELTEQRNARVRKADIIGAFMFELHEKDEPIEEFSIRLWSIMVDTVLVRADKTIVYRFRNGTEVEEKV
jgi:DNA invertase Pin-like site-specific DNA recombinase